MKRWKLLNPNIVLKISLFLLVLQTRAQDVVSHYQKYKYGNFNMFELLFLEDDIPTLIEDSTTYGIINRKLNKIEDRVKNKLDDNALETKLVLKILFETVNKNKSKKWNESKKARLFKSRLQNISENVNVGLDFFTRRFSEKIRKDAIECDISNSMLILFLYNPDLYLEARLKDEDFEKLKVHFPIVCSIESCDFPIFLKEKMKKSILLRLKGKDNKYMKQIRKEVEESNPNFVCN